MPSNTRRKLLTGAATLNAATGNRLHDIRIMDLTDVRDRASQVEVGKGKMPVTAVFRTLQKIEYAGVGCLEYEINTSAPQRGIADSLAYMRGALNGQAEG